ncbi:MULTISPECIES: hypothetical protein [unclassified Sphingomonas]|uniref:hypothetical protein n=1 Tax=unclassified Sphingomonas TaxID=196159 RepID=UPI000BC97A6B|nr:MAG: hypothetical protein B7Y98_06535 [Sphingomonas sp. 32-62-10]
MASFKRVSLILLTSCASAALAGCDGATSVASPGPGTLVISAPAPAPAPTPSPTATLAPITAAQFASTAGGGATTPITADEQLALVNAGTNNVPSGFAPLNGILPQGAAAAAPGFNPTTLNPTGTSFFVTANYVGAVNGSGDTAFQGWTCDSGAASFGGTAPRLCVGAAPAGTGGATAVCPTGTTDDGLVSSFRICRLPTLITTDLTLPRITGVVYRLRGQTEVGVDAGSTSTSTGPTLTIAAGVVIAADSSEASNDLLLINRGARINAVGTSTAPIIFTAQQNLAANGVSDSSQGLWGGVIILGRAPTGVCRTGTGPNDAGGTSTTCENAIEGVTGRNYGGPTLNDNSGTIQFVQINYSGIAISEGNELQGLTLGGVGSGTTISNVQSHNSADDGIEIFGGTVNLRFLAITGADDDGFDIDNGYRGLAQFLIAAQKSSGATADSFATEIESNGAEDLLPRSWARYANFTFITRAASQNPPASIRLRGGADGTFVNGIVQTPAGVACVNITATQVSAADRTTVRAANPALQDQGPPVFNSVYFGCQGR